MGIAEDIKQHVAHQSGQYCIVEELLDIGLDSNIMQILVRWRGFDDDPPGWMDLVELRRDVPQLVDEFLSELRANGTPKQKRFANSI